MMSQLFTGTSSNPSHWASIFLSMRQGHRKLGNAACALVHAREGAWTPSSGMAIVEGETQHRREGVGISLGYWWWNAPQWEGCKGRHVWPFMVLFPDGEKSIQGRALPRDLGLQQQQGSALAGTPGMASCTIKQACFTLPASRLLPLRTEGRGGFWSRCTICVQHGPCEAMR